MNVLPVYLPAIGSSDLYDYAIDDLSEMIDVMEPASHTVICIDFNSNLAWIPWGSEKP